MSFSPFKLCYRGFDTHKREIKEYINEFPGHFLGLSETWLHSALSAMSRRRNLEGNRRCRRVYQRVNEICKLLGGGWVMNFMELHICPHDTLCFNRPYELGRDKRCLWGGVTILLWHRHPSLDAKECIAFIDKNNSDYHTYFTHRNIFPFLFWFDTFYFVLEICQN